MEIQFIYGPKSESIFIDMDFCPRKDESVIIERQGEYKVGATEYIIGGRSKESQTVVWLVPK